MPKRYLAYFFFLITLSAGYPAASLDKAEEKPVIVVDATGYPFGQDTPEGAAVEFIRASIDSDSRKFRAICLHLPPTDPMAKVIDAFAKLYDEKAKKHLASGASNGPVSVKKLYSARHLPKKDAVSVGRNLSKYQDIMFVDVLVSMESGKVSNNRTLTLKDKDGKWYVHPSPQTQILLASILYDEPESTVDFHDAYKVVQK